MMPMTTTGWLVEPSWRLSAVLKIGEPVKYVKDKETICLNDDQARHIYKKVESESVVNVDIIKPEIEEDKLGRNNTDNDK